MKVAIPIRSARISPVFDAARRLVLIDVEGRTESGRREEDINGTDFMRLLAISAQSESVPVTPGELPAEGGSGFVLAGG